MAFDTMLTPMGMNRNASNGSFSLPWQAVVFGLAVVAFSTSFFISSPKETLKRENVVAVIERSSGEGAFDFDKKSNIVVINAQNGASTASPQEGGLKVTRQAVGTQGSIVIRLDEGSSNVPPPSSAPTNPPEKISALNVNYPQLLEKSPFGLLPKIGENNLTPRMAYARPAPPLSTKPRIAIVMTGLGIGMKGTADAINKLPGEVTLAFAPYSRDLENQVQRAQREGHELLLQVPMEPQDYPDSDPGPHTLRTNAPPKENMERLHWLMARFPGYLGLTNFMGGKLMSDRTAYQTMLEEMRQRGLAFVDDGSIMTSRTAEIAKKIKLPYTVVDRIADPANSKHLEGLFDEIEALARKNGSASLAVAAMPANVEKLSLWLAEFEKRGLVLVPLSNTLK